MGVTPVPPIPGQLTTPEKFTKRFPTLAQNLDELTISEVITEATSHLEDRASRRLAPFNQTIYTDRLRGIDPDEFGNMDNSIPMSFSGSLGVSYANALNANDLARHFWLDEYAPFYPELWTYDVKSIEVFLTYSNRQFVDIQGGGIIGDSPSATDGHVWLRLGSFTPIGSRVKVIYSGGYTVQIPPALSRACLYQAAKFVMLEAEPQTRVHMDMNEIDSQIDMLIAPWIRA